MQENVLTFKIDDVAGGEFYIDLAESMSIVSRKLHRQQGLWKVDAVCVWVSKHDSLEGLPYSIAIGGAARNWVTRNALVKAYSAWREQQKRAMAASSPSARPTWMDFKVWLSDNHRTNGSITPTSGHMFGSDDPYIAGEWAKSVLVWEDIDSTPPVPTISLRESQMHIIGADNGNTSVGLIANYQNSRAVVQSPDPLNPAALATSIYAKSEEAINEVAMELVENLDEQNDEPPYSQLSYPGGAANGDEPLLYAFAANTSTLGRKLVMNGFSAPNGLLEVQVDSVADDNMDIWLQFFVSGREAY